MTTIVGIEGNGWAVMAADSQITDDNLKIISTDTPKLIKFKDIIIGLRGDARPGDIIAYNWKPPKISGDIQTWVVGKMIPSMIKSLDKFGYDWKNNEAEFNFLVCVKGKIFDIGSDMSISRSNYKIHAIGSGGNIALGYLYAKYDEISLLKGSQAVAEKAIEASSLFDIHTSGPIQIEVWKNK